MRVILVGHARVGKDTFGSFFIKSGYQRLAFADQVKLNLSKLLNIPAYHLSADDTKEKYRQQMIDYAESERLKDEYIWVKRAYSQIFDSTRDSDIVITDCRRIPEITYHIEKNIPHVIIHIHKAVNVVDNKTEEFLDYLYKNDLVDFHVYNYSDIDYLNKQFFAIFKKIQHLK